MKKVFILVFSILILVSCQSNENNQSNKYLLGDFGDYAYYEDESNETLKIEDKINSLNEDVVNKINSTFFFSILN